MTCDHNNNLLDDGQDTQGVQDKPWTADDFQIGFQVGQGRFGRVYVAREMRTSHKFEIALKVLDKFKLIKQDSVNVVGSELNVHMGLSHENIIGMLGWFHDEDKIYIILELAAKSLFKLMTTASINATDSAEIIFQVACGLDYLHGKNIIHRDLKPENILIDHFKKIKLADFGWAKYIDLNDLDGSQNKSVAGTPDYLAPEMLSAHGYNQSLDCWCVGILCFELLAGEPPFYSTTEPETYLKIRRGVFTYPPQIKADAQDLIGKLLLPDPKQRLSCEQVTKHYWIAQRGRSSLISRND